MEKENYNFLKSEFDKQVAAYKDQLEQKYTQQKASKDLEAGVRQLKSQQNFELSRRTFGVSKGDLQSFEAANSTKHEIQNSLFEQQKIHDLKKFEAELEKRMWQDFGGSRLKAKEAAFGPNDPEVRAHNEKLLKQKEQQQALEASRQQQTGLTKEFNRVQARQNIKEQVRGNEGRERR